jgi:type IV pilus assembly protein PilX
MKILWQQQGSALITALIILTLLSLIGIAATNTSTLETMIAATEKVHSEAFYAAEGGVEHLRRNFKNIFVDRNNSKIATGVAPDWDFALNGSETAVSSATGISYAGAADWITNGTLGSRYLYTVKVWDNDDGGSPPATDDTDGVIFMRAEAQVPNQGFAAVEITLFGGATDGGGIGGYGAQEGGGSGKNYNSTDAGGVTNFSTQIP